MNHSISYSKLKPPIQNKAAPVHNYTTHAHQWTTAGENSVFPAVCVVYLTLSSLHVSISAPRALLECRKCIPANTTHRHNVGPMLGRRRRRWADVGSTLGRCVVFAGMWSPMNQQTQAVHPMVF